MVVDECHHIPAAAFTTAVATMPTRRWLGLTATPYRRDQLDDLIAHQLGPVRHTVTAPEPGTLTTAATGDTTAGPAPIAERTVAVHETGFVDTTGVDPTAPGGMAAIHRALAEDPARNRHVVTDVVDALERGRHCLVLTGRTTHLDTLASLLREAGRDPVLLHGRLGARQRRAALERLNAEPGPLLVVATDRYIGEGFDCPALDTVFLAVPIAFKGRLVQCVGRVLRLHRGKHTVEVHDYHDPHVGVLAASLAKRSPGYRALGFPDPRNLPTQPPPAN